MKQRDAKPWTAARQRPESDNNRIRKVKAKGNQKGLSNYIWNRKMNVEGN